MKKVTSKGISSLLRRAIAVFAAAVAVLGIDPSPAAADEQYIETQGWSVRDPDTGQVVPIYRAVTVTQAGAAGAATPGTLSYIYYFGAAPRLVGDSPITYEASANESQPSALSVRIAFTSDRLAEAATRYVRSAMRDSSSPVVPFPVKSIRSYFTDARLANVRTRLIDTTTNPGGDFLLEFTVPPDAASLVAPLARGGDAISRQILVEFELRGAAIKSTAFTVTLDDIKRSKVMKDLDSGGAAYVSASQVASALREQLVLAGRSAYSDEGVSASLTADVAKKVDELLAETTMSSKKIDEATAQEMDKALAAGLGLKATDFQPIQLRRQIYRSFAENTEKAGFEEKYNRELKTKHESIEASAEGSYGAGAWKASASVDYKNDMFQSAEEAVRVGSNYKDVRASVMRESGDGVELVGRGLRLMERSTFENRFSAIVSSVGQQSSKQSSTWGVVMVLPKPLSVSSGRERVVVVTVRSDEARFQGWVAPEFQQHVDYVAGGVNRIVAGKAILGGNKSTGWQSTFLISDDAQLHNIPNAERSSTVDSTLVFRVFPSLVTDYFEISVEQYGTVTYSIGGVDQTIPPSAVVDGKFVPRRVRFRLAD